MKHKIGARLGAFEQQTSNLRCLRHTTTSNNLLYMLKTSFKSFYYIFCSKLILDLIYIFLGRLSMSPGGPPARSRWLGPKRADKIVGQKKTDDRVRTATSGKEGLRLTTILLDRFCFVEEDQGLYNNNGRSLVYWIRIEFPIDCIRIEFPFLLSAVDLLLRRRRRRLHPHRPILYRSRPPVPRH